MKISLKKTLLTVFAVSCAIFFSSCGTTTLYSWSSYQTDYYHYVKNSDKESLDKLLKTYDEIIEKQKKGSRGVVPPGIYADYGYILLENGKTEEAKSMFAKEIELYPESEVFVGALLKRCK